VFQLSPDQLLAMTGATLADIAQNFEQQQEVKVLA
jgi:hypothetical protein